MKEVTRRNPCRVCGQAGWCLAAEDGAAICYRADTGEGYANEDKNKAPFWFYPPEGQRGGARTATIEAPVLPSAPRADTKTLHAVYGAFLASLTLSSAHRGNLRGRGLADNEIDARGYRTLPLRGRYDCARRLVECFGPDVCARVPGLYQKEEDGKRWWTVAGSPGLLIPVRDVDAHIVALAVRVDEPGDGGKYRWVSSVSHDGPGPGSPAHVPVFTGNRNTVRLTEGALKSDVATVLSGTLTVGLAGVSALSPGIDAVRTLGAHVVSVAFDADAGRNPHVARALDRAVTTLGREKFEVHMERWDERDGKGIDDLLAGGKEPEIVRGGVVAVAVEERSEPEEPAAAIQWPDPPHEAAFYGLPGKIVRALSPHTEADPVALLAQEIVAFGNVIGRTAHFVAEADKHFCNLFATLVGATAKGRKGSSWGQVRAIYMSQARTWAETRILHGLSSGEGLIWAVRDPIEKRTPIKQGGRVIDYQMVIDDPGQDDKRLLVFEGEFASVLQVLKREGNTLSSTLRNAWDTGTLETLTKNNAARATGAHISIVAHITKAELLQYLDSTQAGNGFGNRFLWICVRRSQILPEGGRPDAAVLEPLKSKLADAIQFAGGVGEMTRDPLVREAWRKVYPSLSAGKPGLLGAMLARSDAQVMRLACIYALMDRSAVIGYEHLRAALALWQYAEASARFIFGDALGDPVADEVLKTLRRRSEGMTRTEIRDHFGRNLEPGRLQRALGSLLENGLARSESITETGGRPAERWHAL